MTIFSWQQAKDLIVTDVDGKQIEHVKCTDPDKGWIEVWCLYEAHPDYKSLWIEDGKAVEKDVMLLSLTDMTGYKSYMTKVLNIDFDLVNWKTGLVVREVRRIKTASE